MRVDHLRKLADDATQDLGNENESNRAAYARKDRAGGALRRYGMSPEVARLVADMGDKFRAIVEYRYYTGDDVDNTPIRELLARLDEITK